MRLTELKLQNLRAFGSESFDLYDFTTLIGPNNCGKSTVLRAIEILLGQVKPSEEEWNQQAGDVPIRITGRFVDITDEERNAPGVASLVYNAEIQLRLTISRENRDLHYEAYTREEHIEGWSDTWGALGNPIREAASMLGIDGAGFRRKSDKERVRQYIRGNRPDLVEYGDPDWTDEGISINEALKQALPRVELVPAVRDAGDEERITQRKNIFQEILDGCVLPEVEATDEYTEIVARADELSHRMLGNGTGLPETCGACQKITEAASAFIDLDVLLRLETPDIMKALRSGARIRLSDGTETPVGLQGHGAQRALVYALVSYIAEKRAVATDRQRSTVLLFEEPEIHVHPQLLRTLRKALKAVAGKDGWQVVLSTHSPVMVDVGDQPQALVIMRRDRETHQPVRQQLKGDPFADLAEGDAERSMLRATLDFHPTVCEAFFADSVVLVEGDSEIAVLRSADEVLAQLGYEGVNVNETTIVSCGGKWTIVPIARLLRAFGISCKAVHDIDRKGLSEEELADLPPIHPFNANGRIADLLGDGNVFAVDDTLEDILFADDEEPSGKDKPYAAWKQMRAILENGRLADMTELAALFRFVHSVSTDII